MTSKKENPVCLRCSGPMEIGYLPDTGEKSKREGTWYSGDRITARSIAEAISGKVRKANQEKKKFYIDAYRCTLCGYLELYANREA